MVSFAELIELPVFERREDRRKKVFKLFWMTSDENFEIIKELNKKRQKKKLLKKKKKILKKKQWQKQEK